MKEKGYVVLPCFTVELNEKGDFELTCNDFLGWIFETFFVPFWNGRIYIVEDKKPSKMKEKDDKVQRKWDKLKKNKKDCPHCRGKQIHLCKHSNQLIKKYWLECQNCHWCGKSKSTIRSAIRVWNKESDAAYLEMLKRTYGGE